MITVPDAGDEELLAMMREIAQCMAAIRDARGETVPYSRETLDVMQVSRAAVKLAARLTCMTSSWPVMC